MVRYITEREPFNSLCCSSLKDSDAFFSLSFFDATSEDSCLGPSLTVHMDMYGNDLERETERQRKTQREIERAQQSRVVKGVLSWPGCCSVVWSEWGLYETRMPCCNHTVSMDREDNY